MREKTWEFDRILREYLDNVFDKMRLDLDPRLKYDHGKEKIELLKRADILRMAAAKNASEQMLLTRASYKRFVVVAFLSEKDDDFKGSLSRLEDTARKTATRRSMPKRPRFLEKIFQE